MKIAHLTSILHRRDNKITKLSKENENLVSDIETKRLQLKDYNLQLSGTSISSVSS